MGGRGGGGHWVDKRAEAWVPRGVLPEDGDGVALTFEPSAGYPKRALS